MYKKILIAYDVADKSDAAFKHALALSESFGSTIDVLTVARPLLIGDDVEQKAEIERYQRLARRAASQLTGSTVAGRDVNFHLEVGQPPVRILGCAQQLKADLIVMGCHGIPLIERLVTGSTVRLVMATAHCPILVVPLR